MKQERESQQEVRKRARDVTPGKFGSLRTGPLNAITDVPGVRVGQVTLVEGKDVRTGVTAVIPHGENIYHSRVPAGLSVANGFGKLIGASQLAELGELETPILLTNTLAAPRAADALIRWTLQQQGNEQVTTVNPFVGETNDSRLNDIRSPRITEEDFFAAIQSARTGPVAEGAVGGGTGTVAFGFKGGIGTSSRLVDVQGATFTVGALVQSNYGGDLRFAGSQIPGLVESDGEAMTQEAGADDGSIMMVIATDAPLSDRNLGRLAARAHAGLARTGSSFSNGSGDYSVAFSVAEDVRRPRIRDLVRSEVRNQDMSPLFRAVIDAVEEAILNSLCMAADMQGFRGTVIRALPLDVIRSMQLH